MKKGLLFLTAFVLVILILLPPAALRANAATVLPGDVSSPRDGCVFLGIEGKYIVQIQEALDLINQIRMEACREGVKNPSTGNPLTMADYVPIKWSSDLEYVARIRAAESSLTMGHSRLNNGSIWGVTGPKGISSFGEVIAWNWSETMTGGINQWYGEKSDWVNNTGGVTGHYTQMIDPEHLYVGLATFCSPNARYYNTTVGEFSFYTDQLDGTQGKATGDIIQTVEVDKSLVSYEIAGTDALSVRATVTWTGGTVTKGLVILGGAADKVQWSSSDNNVVTVTDGKLTLKRCGSAVITAKLSDGKTLTKNVTYEHSYKTVTTDASCKSEGKIVKTCENCGDTSTQVIPKTNKHSYKTVTTNATCKSEGKIVNTCTVCGDSNTQVIPKTNKHSYKTVTTNATCQSEGKIVNTCTVCGDSNTQVIPKTDKHSFGSWTVTKAPTASSVGIETRTCSVCKTAQTREISYQAPGASKPGESVGNPPASSSDANSGSGSSVIPSSSSQIPASGIPSSAGTSSVPGASSSGAPASSQSAPSPTLSSEADPSAPGTSGAGDDSRASGPSLWIILGIAGGVLVAGAAAVVIVVIVRKKKK